MTARLRAYLNRPGLGWQIIRATLGSAALRVAGMGLGFLVGIQLARGLGPEGYGIYGLAMSIIALLQVPTQFGVPQLATRELAAARARGEWGVLRGFLRWSLGLVVLAALVVGASVLIGLAGWGNLESDFGRTMLWALLLVPFASLIEVWGGALRGLGHVTFGQVPEMVLRPGLFSCLLLLAVLGILPALTPAGAMLLHVVAGFIAMLVAGFWLIRYRPREAVAHGPVTRGGLWLQSAFPMALTEGMRMLQGHAAILLLGLLATAAMVGLFKVAVSVAVIVSLPIALINVVLATYLARLFAEGDTRRLQRLCSWGARAMAAGVMILILPLLVRGEWLLASLFGKDFEASLAALLILSAGHFCSACMGPNAALLNMSNHEKRVTRAFFIAAFVNIAVAFGLIPMLGIMGAALANMIGMLVWNLLMLIDARRLLEIDTSILGLAPKTGRVSL